MQRAREMGIYAFPGPRLLFHLPPAPISAPCPVRLCPPPGPNGWASRRPGGGPSKLWRAPAALSGRLLLAALSPEFVFPLRNPSESSSSRVGRPIDDVHRSAAHVPKRPRVMRRRCRAAPARRLSKGLLLSSAGDCSESVRPRRLPLFSHSC